MPRLKVLAAYGAYTEYTLYYVVEADDYDTVEKFLVPSFKRSTATITPSASSSEVDCGNRSPLREEWDHSH